MVSSDPTFLHENLLVGAEVEGHAWRQLPIGPPQLHRHHQLPLFEVDRHVAGFIVVRDIRVPIKCAINVDVMAASSHRDLDAVDVEVDIAGQLEVMAAGFRSLCDGR